MGGSNICDYTMILHCCLLFIHPHGILLSSLGSKDREGYLSLSKTTIRVTALQGVIQGDKVLLIKTSCLFVFKSTVHTVRCTNNCSTCRYFFLISIILVAFLLCLGIKVSASFTRGTFTYYPPAPPITRGKYSCSLHLSW